jgi:hypothetical protein
VHSWLLVMMLLKLLVHKRGNADNCGDFGHRCHVMRQILTHRTKRAGGSSIIVVLVLLLLWFARRIIVMTFVGVMVVMSSSRSRNQQMFHILAYTMPALVMLIRACRMMMMMLCLVVVVMATTARAFVVMLVLVRFFVLWRLFVVMHLVQFALDSLNLFATLCDRSVFIPVLGCTGVMRVFSLIHCVSQNRKENSSFFKKQTEDVCFFSVVTFGPWLVRFFFPLGRYSRQRWASIIYVSASYKELFEIFFVFPFCLLSTWLLLLLRLVVIGVVVVLLNQGKTRNIGFEKQIHL